MTDINKEKILEIKEVKKKEELSEEKEIKKKVKSSFYQTIIYTIPIIIAMLTLVSLCYLLNLIIPHKWRWLNDNDMNRINVIAISFVISFLLPVIMKKFD